MKEALASVYLDYLNNFLTVGKFAAYYGMSQQEATVILQVGRRFHEEFAEALRTLGSKPVGPPNQTKPNSGAGNDC